MKTTLFARQNASRRPKFQIRTSLVKDGSTLQIEKKAVFAEADTHLLLSIKNEEILAKDKTLPFSILQGNKVDSKIIYKFLDSPTLELAIEKALLKKNWVEAHKLFLFGLSLIRQLPQHYFEVHPEITSYKTVFGVNPPKNSQFLNYGLIDIAAGNIVLTKPKPTLIDCEWLFPFPIERDFVEQRFAWNLLTRFSTYWKLHHKDLSLVWDQTLGLVAPTNWLYEIGTNTTINWKLFLKKEQAFQEYVLAFNKGFVPNDLNFLPFTPTILEHNQFDLQAILQDQLSTQREIANLRTQLLVLHHSKWWQLLFLIKNPMGALKKYVKEKFGIDNIRLKSFIRRALERKKLVLGNVPTTDLSTLNLHTKALSFSLSKSSPVDVLIPVFNAFDEVKVCVSSVLKYSPANTTIIIVDDCSTDTQLRAFYKEVSKDSRVKIHFNSQQKGFVANINKAFKLSTHDVIILNTDTEVTERWVEKLQAKTKVGLPVATVTPLTNNGEICSVPQFIKPNPLPRGTSAGDMNALVERFASQTLLPAPTGVGFCMYITKEALDAVGLFDEQTFGRGYGEENDFCIRAEKAGFSNLIDDSTFIYHKGGGSFTSEEKQAYIEKNLKILGERYPSYHKDVASFIKLNPLRHMQDMLSLSLKMPEWFNQPSVLLMLHKDPFKVIGGVELDVLEFLKLYPTDTHFILLHRGDTLSDTNVFIKFIKKGKVVHQLKYSLHTNLDEIQLEHEEMNRWIEWVLTAFPEIKIAHIEHSYGFPEPIFGQDDTII